MTRALFLDRDGVINQEVNYLYRIADVAWVDGIFDLCRTAASLGYKIVVVTNQAGIARGYYTVEDFHTLMDWMRAQFNLEGVSLDAVYFSPYHPEGQGEYARDHEDRKPNPGMLLRAANRSIQLDLARSRSWSATAVHGYCRRQRCGTSARVSAFEGTEEQNHAPRPTPGD